jgi:adenylyltransferase/sulfurtransferase
MGALQALEVLKEAAGIGAGLAGKLLIYEALAARFRTVSVSPDPDCPLCGHNPSIRNLTDG